MEISGYGRGLFWRGRYARYDARRFEAALIAHQDNNWHGAAFARDEDRKGLALLSAELRHGDANDCE
jgi:hypothetical protein